MSAYVTLPTPMIETRHLVGALADLGFSEVEVHEEAVPLVGYEGWERNNSAHVVIRRKYVGRASNDLGFLRTPTGFRLIVSEYDRPRFGEEWLKRLRERYAAREAEEAERIRRSNEARRRAEEARRAEERRKLVEAQRRAVIEQARKRGYRIEELREGERVRLIVRRRVY